MLSSMYVRYTLSLGLFSLASASQYPRQALNDTFFAQSLDLAATPVASDAPLVPVVVAATESLSATSDADDFAAAATSSESVASESVAADPTSAVSTPSPPGQAPQATESSLPPSSGIAPPPPFTDPATLTGTTPTPTPTPSNNPSPMEPGTPSIAPPPPFQSTPTPTPTPSPPPTSVPPPPSPSTPSPTPSSIVTPLPPPVVPTTRLTSTVPAEPITQLPPTTIVTTAVIPRPSTTQTFVATLTYTPPPHLGAAARETGKVWPVIAAGVLGAALF